jgi:hypothetical protein
MSLSNYSYIHQKLWGLQLISFVEEIPRDTLPIRRSGSSNLRTGMCITVHRCPSSEHTSLTHSNAIHVLNPFHFSTNLTRNINLSRNMSCMVRRTKLLQNLFSVRNVKNISLCDYCMACNIIIIPVWLTSRNLCLFVQISPDHTRCCFGDLCFISSCCSAQLPQESVSGFATCGSAYVNKQCLNAGRTEKDRRAEDNCISRIPEQLILLLHVQRTCFINSFRLSTG